jgi:PAS domain-containing protein
MLNRIIYGDDILAQAKSLAIKSLYIKWKTLSQLKRLTLTDFLEGDDRIRGNFIVMLDTGDDYAVVYHGAQHRKAVGQDLSGKLISESDTRVARAMRQIFDQVREMGIPVRLIYASDGAQYAVGWERLILPIRLAGEVRLLINYAEPLNTSGDIHNFLFENSPHMLIVAQPTVDYEEHIVDADIIQVNPTAARFFDTERFTEFPIRLRQLAPWFHDDDIWRMLTARTDSIERNYTLVGATPDQIFKCVIIRLDYLLVFRIYLIDTPELVAVG